MSYFESILNTYQHNHCEYTVNEEAEVAFMLVQTNVSQCTVVATSDEDMGLIHIFARLQEFCPTEKIHDTMRLLNKLNFLINVGAWTLDEADGEVRFRIIQAHLAPPDLAQIEQHLQLVIVGHDSFAEKLLSYFNDEVTIEDLFETIEELFSTT
ncbi:MAG: hypothetical protein CMK59_02595 [Proteobacteria bacterium]|nr:hypothetical protein [Pseudomonadota bacterium]